jgi:hypothetical protein
MQSLQIIHQLPVAEHKNYSELQVLKSRAGWYVGTTHRDPETKIEEPGSRDTDYFHLEKDAVFALRLLELLQQSYKPSSLYADRMDYIATKYDSIMYELGLDPREVGYRFNP